MLRFGVAVAAVLVLVVIVYGAVQAEEQFNDDEAEIVLATSTPAVVAIPQPKPRPEPTYPPAPPREYNMSGSDILIQVRGGDNPCRYLYTGNGVGTFADAEVGLWFVAGTWDKDLAETGEMHLYGPTGPHRFYFKDSTGQASSFMDVPRGGTVYYAMTFAPGMYRLYDRLAPELGTIGEIFASPQGQPGYFPVDGWVGECAS